MVEVTHKAVPGRGERASSPRLGVATILGALGLALPACNHAPTPPTTLPPATPGPTAMPTPGGKPLPAAEVRAIQAELKSVGSELLAVLASRDFSDRPPIQRFVDGPPGAGELRLDADADLPGGALCRYDNAGTIACSPAQLRTVLTSATIEQRRTFLSFVLGHEIGHYVAKRAAVVPSLPSSTSLKDTARQLNMRLPEAIDLERRADAFAKVALQRLVDQWARELGSVEATRTLVAGHLRLLQDVDALATDARRESAPLPASAEYARWHAEQIVCDLQAGAGKVPQFPGTHPDWSARLAEVTLFLAGQRPTAQGCEGVPVAGSNATTPAGLVGAVGPILSILDCHLAFYDAQLRTALQTTVNEIASGAGAAACGAPPPPVVHAAPSVVADWTQASLALKAARPPWPAATAVWAAAKSHREIVGTASAAWSVDGKLVVVSTDASVVAIEDQAGSVQAFRLPCAPTAAASLGHQQWALCEAPLRVVRWDSKRQGVQWTIKRLGEVGDTVSGDRVSSGALAVVSGQVIAALSTPNGEGFLFKLPSSPPQNLTAGTANPSVPTLLPPWHRHSSLRTAGPLRPAALVGTGGAVGGAVAITDSAATVQVHHFTPGLKGYRRAFDPDASRHDAAMAGVSIEDMRNPAPTIACAAGGDRVLCIAEDGEVFELSDKAKPIAKLPSPSPITTAALCEHRGEVFVLTATQHATTLRQLGASTPIAEWAPSRVQTLDCGPALLPVSHDRGVTHVRTFPFAP
jgi:hypothetical protein